MGIRFEDDAKGVGLITVNSSHAEEAYGILSDHTIYSWPIGDYRSCGDKTFICIGYDDKAGRDIAETELRGNLDHLKGFRVKICK